MQLSFTASLNDERAHYTIGRVSAHTAWRAGPPEASAREREQATRALMREAEDYGADGVVEIAFAVEECPASACEGIRLRRVVATGRAVKLSLAA